MPPHEPQSESEDKPTWRERVVIWLSKVQFVTYTTLVILLLLLGFLWPRMFITVPPGNHAVMYRYFRGGTVTDRVWDEGLHVVPPWDRLTLYETRLQQQKLKFDVLSDEGLNLGVEVSVRYRPSKDMLGHLHKDIGTDYFERLIRPEVEAHVRRTFGSRPAHEIYASARDVLQELGQLPVLGRLEESTGGATSRPYVVVQELKLVDIELPAIVESAIAERYRQEQLMLEYRYKLEREVKEAERKRTEAAGIRDYSLIAGKISPEVLRWRGVDATIDLAKSQNSKVIMIGGGQGGLPVLLNINDGPSGAPAVVPPTQEPIPPQANDKKPPVAAVAPPAQATLSASPATAASAKPAASAAPYTPPGASVAAVAPPKP